MLTLFHNQYLPHDYSNITINSIYAKLNNCSKKSAGRIPTSLVRCEFQAPNRRIAIFIKIVVLAHNLNKTNDLLRKINNTLKKYKFAIFHPDHCSSQWARNTTGIGLSLRNMFLWKVSWSIQKRKFSRKSLFHTLGLKDRF